MSEEACLRQTRECNIDRNIAEHLLNIRPCNFIDFHLFLDLSSSAFARVYTEVNFKKSFSKRTILKRQTYLNSSALN